MILNERDARHEHILQVARQMMTAARTAPKGKGIDIIEVALITDEEIKQLSDTIIGSACATAADLRVDTRVMFSAGLAAQRLNWLKDCKMVMAIPVSASSKNPFFDRKPKQETNA